MLRSKLLHDEQEERRIKISAQQLDCLEKASAGIKQFSPVRSTQKGDRR
jgi:hypothetical protein